MTTIIVHITELGELKTFRLTCRKCRKALTLDVERWTPETLGTPAQCPFCREDWGHVGNTFNVMAEALRSLLGHASSAAGAAADKVTVQLEVPGGSAKS